jgi:hypothetical protein
MIAPSRRRPVPGPASPTPRPVRAGGIALMLALVLGVATLATLFRFFQFVAWT